MRPPGATVLDRYVVRELLSPLLLGWTLFTFFLVIDRIYHLTDLVITKGVPFHLVVQLLVFMLPSFLAHTLPMAVLVSALLAGGRLAADREIIALKSAGVSPLRLLRPVIVVAMAVMLVTATLTVIINPIANRQFQQQLFKILQTRALSGVQERVFNTTFGDIVLYVEQVSPSQVALRNVLVSDERDRKLSRIIFAREGRIFTDETNLRFTLRLLHGAVNEADVTPVDTPVSDGATPGGAASAERYRHTAFSVYDMNLAIDSPLKGTTRMEKPEKDLSTAAVARQITALAGDTHGRAPFEVEWHKRVALPVAALILALVGFPLAIRSHRGGRSIALVASLVILVFYYMLLAALETQALRLRLPAWFAVWMPNAIFAAIGLGLVVAAERDWRWAASRWLWHVLALARQHLPRPRRFRRGVPDIGEPSDSTHIMDRYLIGQFVGFMGVGLAVTAAAFIVIDLLQTLDRYLRVKPPVTYILEHFAYRLPAALHDGLPVVMLVATIFLYLTISRSHELTALKAAGVSLYRVSAPVLVLALFVACTAGAFQELVLPVLNERGDEVDRVKIRGQLPRHLQSRERMWVRSADTRFYRVELLEPGTNEMHGMTIMEIDEGFRVVSRLDARRARWTPVGWVLNDGAFREVGGDGRVTTVPFVATTVQLPEDMDDFTEIQKPVSAMSYRELREYVARLESAGFQVRRYLVELYSKLSFPLVNLVMVLVAIPFAIQPTRAAGRLFGIALAIVIMAGYLVVHYSAIAFARADLLPPFVAAWTANVIFMGLGVSLLLHART